MVPRYIHRKLRIYKIDKEVYAISLLVGIYGLYVIGSVLASQFTHRFHRFMDMPSLQLDISILFGLSIIYLATILKRRKRNAWLVTVAAYFLYMLFGIYHLIHYRLDHHLRLAFLVRDVIGPIIILGFLYISKHKFTVKSDVRSFQSAIRLIIILLLITGLYGVVGFEAMDNSDFHQEINFGAAVHYTVDQFNLTTNKPVKAYTKRAHLFQDSLSFISTLAVVYALFSLFQPIKARFADQIGNREKAQKIMEEYGAQSEEFFKLWPHDKQYFFDKTNQSVIAYYVQSGVALILSDPVGNKKKFKALMDEFSELCFTNDWLPALVHVADTHYKMYRKNDFTMQLLGQEAIVDIEHFQEELKSKKYFRQICNRFNKQGYTYELLSPPHHSAVVNRLRVISDEWLSKGSRAERGLVMGYFTEEYIQMCDVLVARDAAGTIQAFANMVPAPFDKEEATYDMLRQSNHGLSNINDYLLINMIDEMSKKHFKRLNMGLSPLSGLDNISEDERGLVDGLLRFAYANGDKFFSFSGLFKFKDKYEPKWEDRYIGFKGGLPGFSKTMAALTRSMSKVVKLPPKAKNSN